MKIPNLSNMLSLLHKPIGELFATHRPSAENAVSRSIEIAEDTLSLILRNKSRRQLASEWQGLAPQKEFVGEKLRLSARTESCHDFNGDFYGLEELAPGTFAFFLGDVSGKGLRAAFYQTSCMTLLKQSAHTGTDPKDVVSEMNRVLAGRKGEERFATMLYGVFDSSTNTLSLVSAGHPHPFLISAEGEISEVDCPNGLPVGLDSRFCYQTKTLKVQPGSTLVLYSDGLSEARNSQREFLGEMGLLNLLIEFSMESLPKLTQSIMSEVKSYEPKQSDDQTIVALKFGESAAA